MTAPLAAGAAARAGAGAGAGAAGATTGARGATAGARASTAGRSNDLLSGAGVGQLLTGKSKASSALPKSSARKLLVAEFVLCMVVLAFSPLAERNAGEKPAAFMKRASAIMGVFFMLGLIATAGRGASRASAAFGGLVTLVLLISSRSIFTVLAKRIQPGVGESTDDMEGADEPTLEEVGEDVAEALEDAAGAVNRLTPLPPHNIGGAGMR